MKHKHILKLTLCAVFMALSFVSTMIFIPLPIGNVNLGDAAVIIGAIILGPIYGAVAGGIGPMLADLASGYALYAPATLIIKAFMALMCALIYKFIVKYFQKEMLSKIIGAAVAEITMIIGYFIYEWVLYSNAITALANVPFNAIQGFVGAFIGVTVSVLLLKNKNVQSILNDRK
ncbi:MAG: ECF transporter S component [Clostridia bacterium]|nr:ECF transporter S component [Clostridia bacterium]